MKIQFNLAKFILISQNINDLLLFLVRFTFSILSACFLYKNRRRRRSPSYDRGRDRRDRSRDRRDRSRDRSRDRRDRSRDRDRDRR